MLLLTSLSKLFFFQIKSENRNPTKCEIETYDETYDRLVTSKLQTTQSQEPLRAAATAAASNKGLFT